MNREEPSSARVPARDKQAEEDLWQRHKAERGVWTEPMLAALERGLKGNKWFSLIDKVSTDRTLQLAWEKVLSNAGACGVDGITVGRFGKDSQPRLLAVKERIKTGTYQPKPVKRVWIAKPGSAEKRPLGIPTVTDRVVDMNPADSHFDFLGYRFKRSRRGRLIKLVRPKSLRKLRDTIKPRTKRTSGRSMEAMIAELNPKLQGWFGYFKHAYPGQLGQIDGWIRGRLRSILRKRRGLKGRGRGKDHQRWPNRYFTELGLYCLLEAKVTGIASLRQGVTH